MRSGIFRVGNYKIKILISSENIKDSPCPAVSNVQPRFNSFKNKHTYLISISICFLYLISSDVTIIPKNHFKIFVMIYYQ